VLVQTIEQIRERYESSPHSEFQVEGRFAVASHSVREGKGGKFAVLELRDPTGSFTARSFDADSVDALAQVGAIDGYLKISTFNGTMSIVLQRYQIAQLDTAEILRFAGLDADAHASRVAQIQAWIDECQGTVYGDVLRAVFAEEGAWDAFLMAPAAVRMHHAEPGGLVRHLFEVGKAGLALLESTSAPFDRAYFLAGVMLHDIGKLDTYTLPPTIAYTAQGQMVEHQIYSSVRTARACAVVNAPRSIELKLVHIIEQAHGAYRHAEWQDPVGLEAKALATADYFSSRLGTTDREDRAQDALDQLIAEDSTDAAQRLGSSENLPASFGDQTLNSGAQPLVAHSGGLF
jgi:3'-5' exoribonuclease